MKENTEERSENTEEGREKKEEKSQIIIGFLKYPIKFGDYR